MFLTSILENSSQKSSESELDFGYRTDPDIVQLVILAGMMLGSPEFTKTVTNEYNHLLL